MIVFVNECIVDGCYNKNAGKPNSMCKKHQTMYDDGLPLKAFYGKTVKKLMTQKEKMM